MLKQIAQPKAGAEEISDLNWEAFGQIVNQYNSRTFGNHTSDIEGSIVDSLTVIRGKQEKLQRVDGD